MELEKANVIAERLKALLTAACERINMDGSDQPAIIIAGSIRRLKPDVGDIEFLCIPKYVAGVDQLDREIGALMTQGILGHRLNKLGRITYGPKNKLLLHVDSGIGVDVFSTTEECWPVALAIRTGPKESNVAIAMAAQRKGWRLLAYGSGFNTPNGLIRCQSEREVFELVGLPYRPPWERE